MAIPSPASLSTSFHKHFNAAHMALKHPQIPNSMKNGSHGALLETSPPKMANLKRNAQHFKIYQKHRKKKKKTEHAQT